MTKLLSRPNPMKGVAGRFDRAASSYDRAALYQAKIAEQVLKRAVRGRIEAPRAALDIGSGTGFIAEGLARHWPGAEITVLDASPAMLQTACAKMPSVRPLLLDMEDAQFGPSFDLVLSSMALHWAPDPGATLRRWLQWLRPNGRLIVSLLIDGSFPEWRDLCRNAGVRDGLWPLPKADFAASLGVSTEIRDLKGDYASAQAFLQQLKATGAATPREGYRPLAPALMRKLFRLSPGPFTATYKVAYIEAPSPMII